jgi:hypothetical protein
MCVCGLVSDFAHSRRFGGCGDVGPCEIKSRDLEVWKRSAEGFGRQLFVYPSRTILLLPPSLLSLQNER